MAYNRVIIVIREEDYDDFLRLIQGDVLLPPTHGEWVTRAIMEQREIVESGDDVTQIVATPGEFSEYCIATRQPCTYFTLQIYAIERAFTQ